MSKASQKTDIKRLIRPIKGRRIAGVAMAFADYFQVDVTLARVALALTLLPWFVPGILIYLLCWFIIPSEE